MTDVNMDRTMEVLFQVVSHIQGAMVTMLMYLGDKPEPIRTALLGELLRIEIELRNDKKERPSAEEYRLRFPEHSAVILRTKSTPPRYIRIQAVGLVQG